MLIVLQVTVHEVVFIQSWAFTLYWYWYILLMSIIHTYDWITPNRGGDVLRAAGAWQGGDVDGRGPPPLPFLHRHAWVVIGHVPLSWLFNLLGFCHGLWLSSGLVGKLQRPAQIEYIYSIYQYMKSKLRIKFTFYYYNLNNEELLYENFW